MKQTLEIHVLRLTSRALGLPFLSTTWPPLITYLAARQAWQSSYLTTNHRRLSFQSLSAEPSHLSALYIPRISLAACSLYYHASYLPDVRGRPRRHALLVALPEQLLSGDPILPPPPFAAPSQTRGPLQEHFGAHDARAQAAGLCHLRLAAEQRAPAHRDCRIRPPAP